MLHPHARAKPPREHHWQPSRQHWSPEGTAHCRPVHQGQGQCFQVKSCCGWPAPPSTTTTAKTQSTKEGPQSRDADPIGCVHHAPYRTLESSTCSMQHLLNKRLQWEIYRQHGRRCVHTDRCGCKLAADRCGHTIKLPVPNFWPCSGCTRHTCP
jgi:hypothetical protein